MASREVTPDKKQIKADFMASQEVPPESMTQKIIVPDGDVILRLCQTSQLSSIHTVCTPDAEDFDAKSAPADEIPETVETFDLVVLSEIICEVSPVFRAMLTGQFREAAEFSSYTRQPHDATTTDAGPRQDLYVLNLPDSDIDAMTLLVTIVHDTFYDEESVPEESVPEESVPEPVLLERLAIACDRYQCIPALQATLEPIVCGVESRLKQRYEEGRGSNKGADLKSNLCKYIDGYCHLLVFAYVMDDPKLYTSICYEIINHHIGPISVVPDSLTIWGVEELVKPVPAHILSDHIMLPGDLTVLLETRRLALSSQVYLVLASPMHIGLFKFGQDCPCLAQKSNFWDRMVRFGLVTDFVPHTQISLSGAVDRIKNLSANTSTTPRTSYSNRSSDLGSLLRHMISPALESRDYLTCLDCFRTGFKSRREKTCRIKHD